MASKIKWRDWANEGELSSLLRWRQQELYIMAERKKIRDRCYQRARRSAAKETTS